MTIDHARAKIRAIEKHLQAGGCFHLRCVTLPLSRPFSMRCRFLPRARRNGNRGEHYGDKCEPKKNSHRNCSAVLVSCGCAADFRIAYFASIRPEKIQL